MAITYPLTMPASPDFAGFKLTRRSVTGMTSSPYTGAQYIQSYPGQWWEIEANLPPMTQDQAYQWRAFLAKLNGMEGTFLMGDPTAINPLGSAKDASGTPQVDGASQSGGTLNIKTGLSTTSGYLLAGDYIQLGSGGSARLHMCLDDVDLDGSGNGSINMWPHLRLSPSDNDVITLSNCKSVFRLSGNAVVDEAQPFPIYSMGFSAIEAL